jgi:hypothetical protein
MNHYEHPKQRICGHTVCYGFSDETPVGKESQHKSLLDKMEEPNPESRQMNKNYLS